MKQSGGEDGQCIVKYEAKVNVATENEVVRETLTGKYYSK